MTGGILADAITGPSVPAYADERVTLHLGDCLDVMRGLPDCSVDAVVTDPPAGISFMGKAWDGDKGGRNQWIAWLAERMAEALRVVKPGGHAIVWALPRTSHWTAMALEDAGWDVRDCIVHMFATGFPKSLDVSKAIDKAAGAERVVVGTARGGAALKIGGDNPRPWHERQAERGGEYDLTTPATDAARQWSGWGTALKPASEHWWVCRKPLSGTVAATVLEYGTGALNIDGCRVPGALEGDPNRFAKTDGGSFASFDAPPVVRSEGRWPSNVVLSHAETCGKSCVDGCPVAELDAQSGYSKSPTSTGRGASVKASSMNGPIATQGRVWAPGDSGGASRFFPTFRYEAKAPTAERPSAGDVAHPTVKPLDLCTWLVRLVTPPGGVVLDPFAGSGTTGEACQVERARCILIEKEDAHIPLIVQRLTKRSDPVRHLESKGEDLGLFALLDGDGMPEEKP